METTNAQNTILDVESTLVYYTLEEMASKAALTPDQLIQLAIKGELTLSVIAADWRIAWGSYQDGETDDEVMSGPVHFLQTDDLWRMLRGESVQVEYLEKTGDVYTRIIKGEGLPTISREDLVVRRADADEFLHKLHGQHEAQSDAEVQPPAPYSGGKAKEAPTAVSQLNLKLMQRREKKSLLNIIYGLSKSCYKDTGKENKVGTADRIAKDILSKGFNVDPSDIKNFLSQAADPEKIEEGDVVEKERLLKILMGLAMVHFGYDAAAEKNAATGEKKGSIHYALSNHVDVDVDTIRRYLNKAKGFMPVQTEQVPQTE